MLRRDEGGGGSYGEKNIAQGWWRAFSSLFEIVIGDRSSALDRALDRRNLAPMSGGKMSIFAATFLVVALASVYSAPEQTLTEKDYLRAILAPELMPYAGLEAPTPENVRFTSDGVGRFIEF